jgi:hypothetical protein
MKNFQIKVPWIDNIIQAQPISVNFYYENDKAHLKICFEINNVQNPTNIHNGIFLYTWDSSPSLGVGYLDERINGKWESIYNPYLKDKQETSLYEVGRLLSIKIKEVL